MKRGLVKSRSVSTGTATGGRGYRPVRQRSDRDVLVTGGTQVRALFEETCTDDDVPRRRGSLRCRETRNDCYGGGGRRP